MNGVADKERNGRSEDMGDFIRGRAFVLLLGGMSKLLQLYIGGVRRNDYSIT